MLDLRRSKISIMLIQDHTICKENIQIKLMIVPGTFPSPGEARKMWLVSSRGLIPLPSLRTMRVQAEYLSLRQRGRRRHDVVS